MREVEKSKSVLYKTRATMPSNDYSGMNDGSSASGASKDYRGQSSHVQDESSAAIEQQLDPEQLQLFAQENQDMLKQYEDQLDKVRYAMAPPSYVAAANSVSALRKSRSWKSQSCNRRWLAISRYSLRISSSWWRTRSIQRRMSGAGTRSSSGRRREGAQRRWFSTAPLPSARCSCCGTCSYDRLKITRSAARTNPKHVKVSRAQPRPILSRNLRTASPGLASVSSASAFSAFWPL